MKTVENVRGLWYAYLCISETMSSLERRVIYEKTGSRSSGSIDSGIGTADERRGVRSEKRLYTWK